MPEEIADNEILSNSRHLKNLENSLQALWEKARRVSDILVQLREENSFLKGKTREFETAVQNYQQELESKTKELSRLQSNFSELQKRGSEIFTTEERESIRIKIKDMVNRINARL
ncbi:MAG: hypothetical protein V1799_02375 [bacterium]